MAVQSSKRPRSGYRSGYVRIPAPLRREIPHHFFCGHTDCARCRGSPSKKMQAKGGVEYVVTSKRPSSTRNGMVRNEVVSAGYNEPINIARTVPRFCQVTFMSLLSTRSTRMTERQWVLFPATPGYPASCSIPRAAAPASWFTLTRSALSPWTPGRSSRAMVSRSPNRCSRLCR